LKFCTCDVWWWGTAVECRKLLVEYVVLKISEMTVIRDLKKINCVIRVLRKCHSVIREQYLKGV
jgi:hypothetical protein